MDVSARFGLPLLAPGQAQKELFHNEALQALEMIVQGVVAGPPGNQPPPTPTVGATYLIGRDPVASWSGHALSVACWTAGGWRFLAPFEGLEMVVIGTGQKARFVGGEWQIGGLDASVLRVNGEQVVSARQPAIAMPHGGPVIDMEARAAVDAILEALTTHGLIAAAN